MPRSSLTAPSMVPGAFAGVSAACLRPPAALALGSARASDQDTGLRSPPDVASAWRGAQQAGVWAEQSRRTARCSKGPREAACPRPPEPPLVTTPVGAALAGRVWALSDCAPWLPSAALCSHVPSEPHPLSLPRTLRDAGLTVPGSKEAPSPAELAQQRGCLPRLLGSPGERGLCTSGLALGWALLPQSWSPCSLGATEAALGALPPRTGWTLSVGQAGGTRPVRKGAVRGSESCRQRPRRAHGARDGDPALRPAVSRH